MTGQVVVINGEPWTVEEKASWGDYWYIVAPDGRRSVRATGLLKRYFELTARGAFYRFTAYQNNLNMRRQAQMFLYRSYRYARVREGAARSQDGAPRCTGTAGYQFRRAVQCLHTPRTGDTWRVFSTTTMRHTDSVQYEFDSLYRNRNALRAHARNVLRRVPGVPVDDVLDEAFMTLWRDVTEDSVDGPLSECVRKYIDRAGWKLARRALKQHQNELSSGLDLTARLEGAGEYTADLDVHGYKATTPERARFAAAFDDAVRSLTPKQREAFILTELRGLTQREAAETIGISRESVADRVDGATAALRKALIEGDAL